jgi:hypothetical protein
MNIQIRTLYFLLLTLLIIIPSCTVEKRLHFPGHTVRWNHSNKANNTENEEVSENFAETNPTQEQAKSIRDLDKKQSFPKSENQSYATNLIQEKVDKFIEKSNFDQKVKKLNTIKNKVSESQFLKKNLSLKSKKSESRPDNDMWGFLGSILVGALVAMAIIIVVALIVIWILSMLPLATAKIIGGILLAGLLLFFILS